MEPAKETTITLTSSLQLANAADLKADKATLQTDETDGQILYTTNGKKVSLQKVPYSDTEKLKNHNEEQGMVTVDGKKYIRLNGLWYRCGDESEIMYRMLFLFIMIIMVWQRPYDGSEEWKKSWRRRYSS